MTPPDSQQPEDDATIPQPTDPDGGAPPPETEGSPPPEPDPVVDRWAAVGLDPTTLDPEQVNNALGFMNALSDPSMRGRALGMIGAQEMGPAGGPPTQGGQPYGQQPQQGYYPDQQQSQYGGGPQSQPLMYPDPDVDPAAYVQWERQQVLGEVDSRLQQFEQQQQQREAARQMTESVSMYAREKGLNGRQAEVIARYADQIKGERRFQFAGMPEIVAAAHQEILGLAGQPASAAAGGGTPAAGGGTPAAGAQPDVQQPPPPVPHGVPGGSATPAVQSLDDADANAMAALRAARQGAA